MMSSAPFDFCKSRGEFHRIKMALSFWTVIPEREKEELRINMKVPRRLPSNKLEYKESKIVCRKIIKMRMGVSQSQVRFK